MHARGTGLVWQGRSPLQSLTPVAGAGATRAWARGYAFVDGDPTRLLRGVDIARHLASVPDARLAHAAGALDGCFAVVLEREGTTTIVLDRYGTVPLYTQRPLAPGMVVSDDPWRVVAASPSPPELDVVAVLDMLRLGYVTGTRTLVEGTGTLMPASIVRVDAAGVRIERYWRLRYLEGAAPREEYAARLEDGYSMLAAQIDALCVEQDREAVLMLSGGIDTRGLAALLATQCASQVRCISYGSDDDPDVVAAREIATAIGFRFDHAPVTYRDFDDEYFAAGVHDVGLTTRLTCGTGARVSPIPRDGLVLTGHTGFLSSDFAVMNWGVHTASDVRRMAYARHYTYDLSEQYVPAAVDADYEALRYRSLDEWLAGYDPNAPAVSEMHRWNQEQRQRNLVYREYQAYGRRSAWMMPLGSHGLVDVFCDIPWSLRLDQALYKQVVTGMFRGRAAGLRSISRVGSRFEFDDRRWKRFRSIERTQPLSGALLTRLLPAAKRFGHKQRRTEPMRYGPTPLRHWFVTDGRARADLLARVDAITADVLCRDGVRAALLDARAGEWTFQIMLAGALTVQGVADEAARVWRDTGARVVCLDDDQPVDVSSAAPTGLPSMI